MKYIFSLLFCISILNVLNAQDIITDTIPEIKIRAKIREIERIDLDKNKWNIVLFDSTLVFKQMYFVNEDNGWIVGGKDTIKSRSLFDYGDNGFIIHTTNGGNNWETQISDYGEHFHSIYFINQNTGFVTSNSTVFKTTNGGRDWDNLNVSKYINKLHDFHYGRIFFENDMKGYLSVVIISLDYDIFVTTYYILSTDNGGQNWDIKQIKNLKEYPTLFPNPDVFIENNTLYTLSNSVLYKITDNGKSKGILYPPSLGSIFFINEKVGYAISLGGMYLLKTVTGGE